MNDVTERLKWGNERQSFLGDLGNFVPLVPA